MAGRPAEPKDLSGPRKLEALVKRAVELSRKARKHRRRLDGDNFYANKLAELRADATNTFRDLSAHSPGDVSAMAEMIQEAFSARTIPKRRSEIAREMTFALRTTWREASAPATVHEDGGLFPLSILTEAGRGYLVSVGRQMNGCFASGWYDACAVMMRRLLEICIIEAFEKKSIAHKITDSSGNYLQLSDLIRHALSETAWTLSRNSRKFLPQLRDVGHQSAHGRYYSAKREDIEKLRHGCRIVIEEFLHHAELL